MVQECRFGKERYIKQINDIWEWQKIRQSLVEKGHIWKESRVTTQGSKEEEVGTLLLGNNKNKL